MAEKQDFKVHPSIIHSTIKSQAGSLAKALLEGVMNAIDAGATKVSVRLDAKTFTIKDDGKGISSRQDLDEYFATFGTPHEEGDAKYGRFRIGRGQLFCFAKTTWRTSSFKMTVDIPTHGLVYDLDEKLKPVKGCAIEGELYEPLSSWNLSSTLTELKKMVKYCATPVLVNGSVVSRDPAKEKWDIETPDAYIKLNKSSQMTVYNQGVMVRDFGTYDMGSGGELVSKYPLALNTARNDILVYSDPRWKKLKELIKEKAIGKIAKKKSLTADERGFLAAKLSTTYEELGYQEWRDTAKQNIVPTAARHVSLSQLLAADEITLVPNDKLRLGERIHRAGRAFVLTQETLERFNVSSVEDLLATIKKAAGTNLWRPLPVVKPIEDYIHDANLGFETVPEQDAPAHLQFALRQLRKYNKVPLSRWLEGLHNAIAKREIYLGKSDSALAWTDGKESIHLDCTFLEREIRRGLVGWNRISLILLHEYCHTEPDLEGHEHDQEFFELFEDLATSANSKLIEVVSGCTRHYTRAAAEKGWPLIQAALLDRV